MPQMPSDCPGCSRPLEVTRLACPACDIQLEGRFLLPELLQLDGVDLQFVVRFVLASGSLKEMARVYGQSYPTIRNRLNEIIARLTPTQRPGANERHAILDAIARGEIDVAEGARRLEEVEP